MSDEARIDAIEEAIWQMRAEAIRDYQEPALVALAEIVAELTALRSGGCRMTVDREETIRAVRLIEDLIRTAELSLNQAKLETSELRRAFMRDRQEDAAHPDKKPLVASHPQKAGSQSDA